MKDVTVLIPTYRRTEALAALLTSLCSQTYKGFDVVISDQNETDDVFTNSTINCIIRILHEHGSTVHMKKNTPRKGVAQQRQFLLEQSQTRYSLFLDDDLILEPYVIEKTREVILEQNIGFAGRPVIGLSYLNDIRPHEQLIEVWEGNVQPEAVKPRTQKWKRHLLHNAANMYHVEQKLGATPDKQILYKVAWVGACVMYDTEKLRESGGFQFWKDLPKSHAGEDVLAQLRVMKKFGGCGILPSGVYHQETPTTIKDRQVNAPEYLSVQL